MNDVYISGCGVISSIGVGTEETLDSLQNEKPGLHLLDLPDSRFDHTFYAGQVALTDEELIEKLQLSKAKTYSRTSLLSLMAAKEAISDIDKKLLLSDRTGIISSNTVGGMRSTEIFYNDYLKKNDKADYKRLLTHECGNSTEQIAKELGITGFSTTISTACSSALNAIALGARLIRSGELDRVLVGGSDALTKFTINGFNSLLIYDKNICRPFSADRSGLNLGEGAGFLFLESKRTISKKTKWKVMGDGNSCDAFHLTASSADGEGAFLAMSEAIKNSNLNNSDIDYIKAHGTGTPNNDLSEGIAIDRVFKNNVPSVSSTKGFTGHTLGASGGIETVFSLLAIEHDFIPPNINFTSKIKEHSFVPVTELKNVEINNVLINAFGFGGNNSSLVVQKNS